MNWRKKNKPWIVEKGITSYSLVPRQYTPDYCLKAGCSISIQRLEGSVIHIHHEQEALPLTSEQIHDVNSNPWGDVVKPWLEARHVKNTS